MSKLGKICDTIINVNAWYEWAKIIIAGPEPVLCLTFLQLLSYLLHILVNYTDAALKTSMFIDKFC